MRVIVFRSRIDPGVFKYCSELADNGHDLTLVMWDRKRNFDINQRKNLTYQIICLSFPAPQDNFFTAFFLPFWWFFMIINLIQKSYDTVHLFDLDTLFPGFLVKWLLKKKIVYTISDFYAYNIPNGQWMDMRIVLRKIIAYIERFLIRFSDLLIVADDSRMDEVKGAKSKKIICIYNTPPDSFSGKNNVVKAPSDTLKIFYAGILLETRGIHHMIQAVQELKDVALTLGGNIADPKFKCICDGENKKIRYIGWIPSYEQLIELTVQADVLFRFSDPSHPKTKLESPNKLFEAMMCGKPIIVSDGSSMAEIVKLENCVIVVTYGDVAAIKMGILRLKNDPVYYRQLGENGRKAYQNTYNWNIMRKRLLDGYNSLE
jgi:glycosyltransferase involved in cell wall biosynthesis